ncbi:hypothetical protein ACNO5E_14140 [Vibrio parahaemolyticus]
MKAKDLIEMLKKKPEAEVEVRGTVQEGYLEETVDSVDIQDDLIVIDI